MFQNVSVSTFILHLLVRIASKHKMTSNITNHSWIHINGSWADQIFPPSLTRESMYGILNGMGFHSLMAFGQVAKILYGPVLWCIRISGALMNLLVIFAELLTAASGVSISMAAISFILTIRAGQLLLLHDILKGKARM